MGTGLPFNSIRRSAVAVMTIPEGSAPPAPARGKFTLVPCCVRAVLVTMKMISNTRKMSVSGVTLISATMSPSFWGSASWLPGLSDTGKTSFARARVRELHEQFVRPVAPERGQIADADHEGVVGEDRQHAHQQPTGGRDQRLGDRKSTRLNSSHH